ncbi:MAG: dTMP kinase [Chitinophagales bacterium]
MQRGKFIVFEGIDGSGKSTQVKLLTERLKTANYPIYQTFEPTNSPIGSLIRNMLYGRIEGDEKTLAALYLADRLDHIQNSTNGMLKYLDKGTNVISDRYYFSSYAYHVPHVSLDWVVEANSICAELLRPDLIIFIDITTKTSLERLTKGRNELDKFENFERISTVRKNYMTAMKRFEGAENVVVIDGNQSFEAVSEAIWNLVLPVLEG